MPLATTRCVSVPRLHPCPLLTQGRAMAVVTLGRTVTCPGDLEGFAPVSGHCQG